MNKGDKYKDSQGVEFEFQGYVGKEKVLQFKRLNGTTFEQTPEQFRKALKLGVYEKI